MTKMLLLKLVFTTLTNMMKRVHLSDSTILPIQWLPWFATFTSKRVSLATRLTTPLAKWMSPKSILLGLTHQPFSKWWQEIKRIEQISTFRNIGTVYCIEVEEWLKEKSKITKTPLDLKSSFLVTLQPLLSQIWLKNVLGRTWQVVTRKSFSISSGHWPELTTISIQELTTTKKKFCWWTELNSR
mgnify:CR=1 FL=1